MVQAERRCHATCQSGSASWSNRKCDSLVCTGCAECAAFFAPSAGCHLTCWSGTARFSNGKCRFAACSRCFECTGGARPQWPANSPNNGAGMGVAGDPFTTDKDGKQVQFYL